MLRRFQKLSRRTKLICGLSLFVLGAAAQTLDEIPWCWPAVCLVQ
jgi:hypothetical protein